VLHTTFNTLHFNTTKMSQYMVLEIVDTIRQNQTNDWIDFGSDPWDEMEAGAGWLDNEIGMFDTLYRIYVSCQQGNYPKPDYSNIHTVSQFVDYLNANQTAHYIAMLRAFIQAGGTNNAIHFDLRKRADGGDAMSVYNYLNGL
jgi:hypothetical protein